MVKILRGRPGIHSACIAAASVLLVASSVSADCPGHEYEVLELTLESVTVDGQPQGDLSGYDDWSVRLDGVETPHVVFTATQQDPDDLCQEEYY